MGVLTEPRLVVKRTFLEYVECSPKARPRSLTDSALSVFTQPLSFLCEASCEASDAAKMTPEDGKVNESATEALKAFLGLPENMNEKHISPAFPPREKLFPVLPSLEEEQSESMSQRVQGNSMQQCTMVLMPVHFNSQANCFISNMPIVANMESQAAWVAPVQQQIQTGSGKEAKADAACASSTEMLDSTRTTVIMRNIPNNYTREMLLNLLDSEGFARKYDFVYMPVDFNTQAGLGYAFVNLVSPAWAQAFWTHLEGFQNWALPSEKVCALNWSCPLQGFEAHVERYRNSPVMHEAMPDAWKPVIFIRGERLPFPPPTKPIKAPKNRSRPANAPSGF